MFLLGIVVLTLAGYAALCMLRPYIPCAKCTGRPAAPCRACRGHRVRLRAGHRILNGSRRAHDHITR
ncbi:hypothetical protein GCM10010406_11020 [Streptomyces thermolineatus]|uniref:Uncharacterized protein n=1 Tax=Streptomyces thermolineatus TaxID=44033 RepID=A0ABN3L2I0_9ACTN